MIVNQLDDLQNKYQNYPKTPHQKKEKKGAKKEGKPTDKQRTKKKEPRSKGPLFTLSKELQAVVGETELAWTELTKKVWDYIKAHALQNPKNKREIIPDPILAQVFGHSNPIDMMQLPRLLKTHAHRS